MMTTLAGGFSELAARERRQALSDAVGLVLKRVEELASAMKSRSAVQGGVVDGGAWAREGQSLTFRAELMPGRDRAQRTFRVAETLTNRRVLLVGMVGEHSRWEFEN